MDKLVQQGRQCGKMPYYIAGITPHASTEMQKDGVTEDQVKDVIEERGNG
ncbi:hypothetical protein AB0L57_31110 [Nocardia sp. NPDC052254]